MKLKLPYPISTNRYWRTYRGRDGYPVTVPSDEARQYKAQVGWIAKAAGLRSPIPGHLEVRVVLHPLRPKKIRIDRDVRSIDLDNALKVAIDALNEIAYGDDSQIRRIVAERGDPVDGGGLAIEILRYEVHHPQPTPHNALEVA